MKFFIYVLVLISMSFLQGCMQEKPKPQVVTDVQQNENNQTTKVSAKQEEKKLDNTFTLKVNAPKNSRVRILNIKPKYHDNIELDAGKYLIEVSKEGYQKYKKWITLDKDLVLQVVLHANKNPYDTKYFQYVTKIEWKNEHDLFTLTYDKKTDLIWAMQSAYVDYVTQHRPRTIVADAVFAKGTPWPKISATKLDTLIYSGYFRYRGRNFLFKYKNEVTLYKGGKPNGAAKIVAHLSKLKINSMVNYYRLPKEKELLRSNPFKSYQKYFQIRYSRYKNVKFNLPILCTKLKKNSFYSNCSVAYAYNRRTGLYDGPRIRQEKHLEAKDGLYFALNHAKNFALVTPVRALETEYDKIIFNTKITAEQKLAAVTTLLIKESLGKKKQSVAKIANKMASKAMHMVFGDPKVYGGKLYATTNGFARNIRSKKKTKVAVASFRVHNAQLHLVSLK